MLGLGLVNCTLSGNTATAHGSGTLARGGGIYSDSGTVTVTNCSFVGNLAEFGGAVYGNAALAVTNSTIAANAADSFGGISCSGSATVSNSIFWQNAGGDMSEEFIASGRRNFLGIDPRFVRDPDSGTDGRWGTEDDDYGDLQLTPVSPAVDYGRDDLLPSDTLDLDGNGNTTEPVPSDSDGNARVYGLAVDCGAHELQEEMAAGREAPSLGVTIAEDVFDLYDGEISLREAIWYVDPEAADNTITFDAALDTAMMTLQGYSFYVDKPVTIDASALDSLTLDAAKGSRVLTIITSEGEVELIGLTLTGGSADQGGGLYNSPTSTLVLTECTLSENSASFGGGVYSSGSAVLTITACMFEENSANSGGALYNSGSSAVTIANSAFARNLATGTQAGDGGGGVFNADSGAVSITSCAFRQNTTNSHGGGILNSGSGTVAVVNSTLAANSASGSGGGIFNSESGILTVTNATLSGNSANQRGGGIYTYGYMSQVALNNTIVAGNWINHTTNPYGPDIYHYISALSGFHNLIGDGSNQSGFLHGEDGNQVGTADHPIDPLLSEWAPFDNGLGGFCLLSGSPAIDAGDDALAVDAYDNPLGEDLYGNPRTGGAAVDIGAVEGMIAGVPSRTYVVTSLEKTIAEDGVLTFFEALEAANENRATADAPAGSYIEPDTIRFAEGLSGTIVIDDAELVVRSNLNIEGPGAEILTFDGGGSNRVFLVQPDASAVFCDITVTGGSEYYGGGVYNGGALTLTDVIVSANAATYGGGIYSAARSVLTVVDSTLAENSASRSGGAIYNVGDLTIVNSGLSENSSARDGGAVYGSDLGSVTVTSSTISGNSTADFGGGIFSESPALVVSGSSISGNQAYCGGGIYSDDGTTIVMNSVVSHNLTVKGLNRNDAHGGGIFVSSPGNLVVTGSTFSENSAGTYGGGLYNSGIATVSGSVFAENSAVCAGGIFNESGTVRMKGSVVGGNLASSSGGGIYNYTGTLEITNVMLAENVAISSCGGGLFDTSGTVTFTNSTISGNSASTGGGVYCNKSDSEAILNNAVVAGNWAESGPDLYHLYGTAFSGSHNFIGDGSNQTGLVHGENANLVGTAESPLDPLLSEWTPFENGFGGYYPLPGSPLLDAGDNSLAVDGNGSPLAIDVCGNARILGAAVDIGAVEGTIPGVAAQTYLVTSLEKTIAEDGIVTFLEALEAANRNQPVGDAPAGSHSAADTIRFAEGLSGTILVDDGELVIRGNLTIEGPGEDLLTFDGNDENRVFFIKPFVSVAFSGMTVQNGSAYKGGGILNTGTLTLCDVALSGNRAGYDGGGICSSGTLDVTDCKFIDNSATRTGTGGSGGGIHNSGTLTVANSVFLGNYVSDSGGGIWNSGTATLVNAVITDSSADGTGDNSGGGACYSSGALTIDDSTLRGNTAQLGAGILNDSGTLTLADCMLSENSASESGGGIYSTGAAKLAVTDCLLKANWAIDYGGGLYNDSSDTATLKNTMIADNRTTEKSGGGVYNTSVLVLVNCAFLENTAANSGGGIAGVGTLTLTNCTLSRNETDGTVETGRGGAIFSTGRTDRLTITNSTISGNSAEYRGGGVYIVGYRSNTVLNNSIVAENGIPSEPTPSGPDIYFSGYTLSGSHNLIGNGSGQNELSDGVDGNQIGTFSSPIDPLLSEWVQFGNGLGGCHLLPSSPALDAGDNALAVDPNGESLIEDIAGNPRILDGTVDIGAVEGTAVGVPAQTYVVTSLEMTVAEDGILTFREALEAANRNQPVGDAAAGSLTETDIIRFDDNLAGTISVDGGELEVVGNLTIEGPGPGALVFDGTGANRVFSVRSGISVALRGITVTGGLAQEGGGILNFGTLTIENSVLSGNAADLGGGIYNAAYGTLTLTDSVISGNSAAESGGGIYNASGTVMVRNSTCVENTTTGVGATVLGGAFSNSGALTIANSTIARNASSSHGGAIYNATSGRLNIDTSWLVENNARNWAGAIYNTGAMAVSNCTIAKNSSFFASAIYNLDSNEVNIANSTVAENSGSRGAIHIEGDRCRVTLNNTIVAENDWTDIYRSTGSFTGSCNLIGISSDQSNLLDGVNGNRVGTYDSRIDPRLSERVVFDDGSWGYYLLADSPAIDAGNDALAVDTEGRPLGEDIYGNARIVGDKVDIGAVEGAASDVPGHTYLVTSLEMTIAVDGVLTFGEALAAANGNRAVGDASAGSYSESDLIQFDEGVSGVIRVDDGELVISGDLRIEGPGSELLEFEADGDNGVLLIERYTCVELTGITVTGGYAEWGGGICTMGTLNIADCTIEHNSSRIGGGGIHNDGGTLTISDSTVSYNQVTGERVTGHGGGIHNNGTLTVTNSTFMENSAECSGGLFHDAGMLTVTSCTFFGNSATGTGDNVHGRGGALTNNFGTTIITKSTFSRNAGTFGGGICNSGAMTIRDCTLSENTAIDSGGGIFTFKTLTIVNSRISNNSAEGTAPESGGGGICSDKTLTVTNSVFSGNSAKSMGGGVYAKWSATVDVMNSTIAGNTAEDSGGGFYSGDEASVEITNCILVGNRSEGTGVSSGGGAIFSSSAHSLTVASSAITANCAESFGGGVCNMSDESSLPIVDLTNTIVGGNTTRSGALSSGADLYNSSGHFQGSHDLIAIGTGQDDLVNDQDGNLIGTPEAPIDPRFVRLPSDGGDGWGDDPDTFDVDESLNDDYGDLRLRPGSPAIDTGSNDLLPVDELDLDADGDVEEPIPYDLAGDTRVENGTVDMGAYEYTPVVAVPGDLNGDGAVGGADLDIIRANWGQTVAAGSLLDGDPSGDGIVNTDDLDIVRANWGAQAASAAAVPSEDILAAGRDAVPYGPLRREDVQRRVLSDAAMETWSAAEACWEEAVRGLSQSTIRPKMAMHQRLVDLAFLEGEE